MNTFFEAIDDHLINWYFANEKEFEKPFQNSLRKSRVELLQNPNDSGYIKAYNTIEDAFYNYVYTLFKKKELDLLQNYIKSNSYDKEFVSLYKSRQKLDSKFLDYLNSKIDFLKL
jgi:hypothetical protein